MNAPDKRYCSGASAKRRVVQKTALDTSAVTENFFMTGTDTGVGKTFVTTLLLAEFRRLGLRAAAMKPIACGRDGRHDAEQYAALMNHEQPLDVLNPVYLRHPLAPSVAARLERRRIDLQKVVGAYRRLATIYSPLLVEGAGGLLVPILEHWHPERSEGPLNRKRHAHLNGEGFHSAQNDSAEKSRPYFVADLARDLGLPLIIVARLGLGTLNHTLLTVRQAQTMGLKVAGIILNDLRGGKRGLAERTNIKVIAELCGVPLLGIAPHEIRKICRKLLK